MIKINNLGFFYNTSKWLFKNITFDIKKGDIVTILGPNGRGKTTFLKCIVGIFEAKEGKIVLGGKVGFVPQLTTPPFGFSVLDIVLMGTSKSKSIFESANDKNIKDAKYWLEKVDMLHLENMDFSDLSGGQRQMVLIARALCYGKDILILDEPTSALDLANQKKLMNLLKELSQSGTTIIMTTHSPNHALNISNSTLMLFGEDKFIFGNSKEVVNKDNLSRLFETNIECLNYNINGKSGTFALNI